MHSPHQIHEPARSKKPKRLFDKFIILASFIYPATAIPQIIQVFSGQCEGLSITSWLAFTGFSLLFMIYGIRNRVIPMIINYSLWVIANGLIFIGAAMCN